MVILIHVVDSSKWRECYEHKSHIFTAIVHDFHINMKYTSKYKASDSQSQSPTALWAKTHSDYILK